MSNRNPTFPEIVRQDLELASLISMHPAQVAATNTILSLLVELDAADSMEAVYAFQEHLIKETLRATSARSDITASEKRVQRRKPPKPPKGWILHCDPHSMDPEEWRKERLVAARVVRQLQSIGDALAWRVLNYSRAAVIALSSNSPAGAMSQKRGLAAELAFARETWKRDGHFVMLHDLTSVLRIADATICFPDGSRAVREIKTSSNASRSAQTRHAARAIAAMFGEHALPIPDNLEMYLFHCPVHLKTDISKIQDLASLAAARGGTMAASIGKGRTLSVMDVTAVKDFNVVESLVRGWDQRREHAIRIAAPGEGINLSLSSVDFAARIAFLAPYGIYPLPAETRAKIITDLTVYTTTISLSRIQQFLSEKGMRSRNVLDRVNGLQQSDPVLRVTNGRRNFTLSWGTLGQLFIELIDPARFASAAAYLVEHGEPDRALVPTYRGEQAVWI